MPDNAGACAHADNGMCARFSGVFVPFQHGKRRFPAAADVRVVFARGDGGVQGRGSEAVIGPTAFITMSACPAASGRAFLSNISRAGARADGPSSRAKMSAFCPSLSAITTSRHAPALTSAKTALRAISPHPPSARSRILRLLPGGAASLPPLIPGIRLSPVSSCTAVSSPGTSSNTPRCTSPRTARGSSSPAQTRRPPCTWP